MLKSKILVWLVVAICSFVVGAAVGGLVDYYAGMKTSDDAEEEIIESETADDVDDLAGDIDLNTETWKKYYNVDYGYYFSYPDSWYLLIENLNPPPPDTIMAASVSQEDVTSGDVYASFFVYARDLGGQTLEDHDEILSLIDDGYTKTEITVSGQEAVRLERRTHELDTGSWVYMICRDTLFRITWGGTSVAVFEENEEILELMLENFNFTGECAPGGDIGGAPFWSGDIYVGPVESGDTVEMQAAVDTGSMPWRLDPLEVAQTRGPDFGFSADDEYGRAMGR